MIQEVCKEHKFGETEYSDTSGKKLTWLQCLKCGAMKVPEPNATMITEKPIESNVPPTEPKEKFLNENEFLDLTGLDEKDKSNFINDITLHCSRELLKGFLSCGLENYIEQMIENEVDGKEYILSFQTKESFVKRFQSVPPTEESKRQDLVQDFKELNKYIDNIYDYYIRNNGKDAGHLWIAFSDKFNAFRNKILSMPTEESDAVAFAEWICKENYEGKHDRWMNKQNHNFFTTQELYQEYKKQTQ